MYRLLCMYRDAYAGLPRVAWVLAAVRFVDSFGLMVLFFFSLYCARIGLSTGDAGTALGAFGVGMLVGGYLGGLLSGRFGPFRIQLGGLLVEACALLAMSQVSSLLLLSGLMFLYGLASSSLHPANATALAQSCEPHILTRAFSLTRLAANLGVTFGPTIGGVLAVHDYRYLFYADGGTSLAALALLALTAPRSHRITPRPTERPGRLPWQDVPFLLLVLLNLVVMLCFNQLFSTFGPYLHSAYGLSEDRMGPLVAINTILIVLVEMPLIQAVRRLSLGRVVAAGALSIGLGYGLMPLGHSWLFAALTVTVWTVGEMLFMPSLSALITSLAGEGQQGRYQGIFSVSFGLAYTFGPPLGLAIFRTWGGDWVWLLMGATALATVPGFLALGRLSRAQVVGETGGSSQ